ncbi:MAG: hypothetical protein ACE5HJ_07565 [Thermoplasmata archaeon]
MEDPRPKKPSWTEVIKDILYGLVVFDLEQGVRSEIIRNKDIFLALTVGELLGLPLHTSYYTLQILPYVFDELPFWKRRACRERWVF